ncbi:wall-associated receptor kinase 5-like [Eucalyptus grandis]|uniref:wall-associated receptor kinase 5-like n=1 Tax=Eucalyptus grandis TaxID=71139 RepID=UPI00192ECF71|nr:wall-associated receptor kinase 5-like [Eucalyptus grandis]
MVIHKLLLKVVVLGALLGSYYNRISEAADLITKPGCRSACGALSIPYPFGLRDSCSNCRIDHPSFTIDCDNSTDPPIPYMHKSSNIEILDISVEDHEMRVNVSSSRKCYNSSGHDESSSKYPVRFRTNFPISSTKNKFIAIGCDTLASFRDLDENFHFGCTSLCSNVSDVSNGSCSGVGCCERSIPMGSFGYEIFMSSFSHHSYVLDFNPCSYGFVAEVGFYNFSVSDLKQLKFNQSTLVLDWAIGNQTCEDAKKNNVSYMCTNNTICIDAENGSGYKCGCKVGYRGNPYLANGCQDIDECVDLEKTPCLGKCHNVEGSYTCSCPKGYHDNGKKDGGNGQGCIANPLQLMEILVGTADKETSSKYSQLRSIVAILKALEDNEDVISRLLAKHGFESEEVLNAEMQIKYEEDMVDFDDIIDAYQPDTDDDVEEENEAE